MRDLRPLLASGLMSCTPGFAALCAALIAAAGSASAAPTETVLHSFPGGSDGGNPQAGLIADSAGNLYGTTFNGGASNYGAVFKLTPGGTEKVLYSFTGGSNGNNPSSGLTADSTGNLYGTTFYGGASNYGAVFKLAPGGTETVLYSFKGGTSDGANPWSGSLIADSSGNLYGTTQYGGAFAPTIGASTGTVFQLSPPATAGGAWTERVLYNFCSLPSCSDGAVPYSGLIADSSGNLYGTTGLGGASGASNYGVVFKLAPPATAGGAWTETVLSPSQAAATGLIPKRA
jgi:uncharacterized repeat protein (TIGR03803 family)